MNSRTNPERRAARPSLVAARRRPRAPSCPKARTICANIQTSRRKPLAQHAPRGLVVEHAARVEPRAQRLAEEHDGVLQRGPQVRGDALHRGPQVLDRRRESSVGKSCSNAAPRLEPQVGGERPRASPSRRAARGRARAAARTPSRDLARAARGRPRRSKPSASSAPDVAAQVPRTARAHRSGARSARGRRPPPARSRVVPGLPRRRSSTSAR